MAMLSPLARAPPPLAQLLLLLLSLRVAACHEAELRREALRPRALFVCRDAGETLAFLPAIQLLNSRGDPRAPPFAVALATTANAEQRLAPLPAAAVLGWERLGLPAGFAARFAERNATLPGAALNTLLGELQPAVVVTGLVSSIQLQLAAAWPGRRRVGYDDGFGVATWVPGAAAGPSSGLETSFVLRRDVGELLVAADLIAAQAQNFSRANSVPLHVTTVGQPTLESWQTVAANRTAAAALHRAILGGSQRPVFTFFGGYGAGYNASIRVLAAAVRAGDLDGYDCLLTPHPGQGGDGQTERAIFAAAGLPGDAVMIVTTASSPQVAAFSNLTASVDSTCGVQSLFIGVPSLYVGAAASSYADVATAKGLIEVAHTRADIAAFLARWHARGYRFDTALLSAAGIPSGAARRIANAVAPTVQNLTARNAVVAATLAGEQWRRRGG